MLLLEQEVIFKHHPKVERGIKKLSVTFALLVFTTLASAYRCKQWYLQKIKQKWSGIFSHLCGQGRQGTLLSYSEILVDVRTYRKVGVCAAELGAVHRRAVCTPGNSQPGWDCSAACIDSHQTGSCSDSARAGVVPDKDVRLVSLSCIPAHAVKDRI